MSHPLTIRSLPPHDAVLEATVLGAALLDRSSLRKSLEMLPDDEVFYLPEHIAVWRAVRRLQAVGGKVDLVTLLHQLRADGTLELVGGPAGLHALTTHAATSANTERHCRLLIEAYARRLTMQAAARLMDCAADPTADPLELYGDAQTTLTRLTRSLSTSRPRTAGELFDAAFATIARACTSSGLTGVPSGWPTLDKLTGGWQPGNLILLAGRPGMGKTTVALAFARQAALLYDNRVLFVSLEMPENELMNKLIAAELGITTHQLAHGNFPGGLAAIEDMRHGARRVKSDCLLIDQAFSLTLGQLRARAAEVASQPGGLKLIIVDYVQLVKADGKRGSREEEVADVSRGLKALALELAVPVMALAQLNREAEKRADKRAQLSDLRESGQLEQDADLIIFPWRGEYYDEPQYADGTATAGTILLDFAKHRNGPTGEVILGCDIATGRLHDLHGPAAPPSAPAQAHGFEAARLPETATF